MKRFDVWYQHASEKVLKDFHYASAFKKQMETLKLHAAKNEYESIQIIISSQIDINNYQLKVSNLYSDNHTFSEKNIKIYHQKYIEITENAPQQAQKLTGFYPDALLPMDTAIEFKENKVGKNNNQGIWITLYIPKGQAHGIYKGEFELIIDEQKQSIPIALEVWDFEIPTEVHIKSDYVIGHHGLIFGERDASTKMYRTYVEKLLEFRLAPHRLVMFNHKNAVTPEAFIEELRYLDSLENRYLSTIVLPIYNDDGGIDVKHYYNFTKALAVASFEDERNYFKRAAAYLGFIDEPHLNQTWDQANFISRQYEEIKHSLADEINNIYPESTFKASVIDSMRRVGNFVTSYIDDKLPDIVNWCPHFNKVRTKELIDKYFEKGYENWIYTCGGYGDVPSLVIDHKNINLRLIPWMQRRYGFTGSLFWDTTVYHAGEFRMESHHGHRKDIDPYKDAQRVSKDSGDGYIFYPGRPYNIFGPVETVRLHALRDGNEEYEYLLLLENLYTQNNRDARPLLEKIYNKLFTGVVGHSNGFELELARIEVAKLIIDAKNGIFKE